MDKPVLTIEDFAKAACELDVEVSALLAVDAIESRGHGFLTSGEPVILFERHIFSRLTHGKYDKTHPSISNPKPGGYGAAGQNQHTRMQQAVELHRDAALKSASWGRFQIMGFNYGVAGHASLQSFINAMFSSEKAQLDAFVSFIRANDLDVPLRQRNWSAFARGYNGPAYAKHNYHGRLKAAYENFRDTPA